MCYKPEGNFVQGEKGFVIILNLITVKMQILSFGQKSSTNPGQIPDNIEKFSGALAWIKMPSQHDSSDPKDPPFAHAHISTKTDPKIK